MSKALSVDLRERVIKAIKAGMSRRQAAARFGVSPASAVRWFTLVQETGVVRPGPLGGDRRSGRIERYATLTGLQRQCSTRSARRSADLPGGRVR
jgi:transposase